MTYPSFTHEELIKDWFRRSQKQKARSLTLFDQFISLWFAFNSWGTYVSKKGTDRQMLDHVKRNTALLALYKGLLEKDLEFSRRIKRLSEYFVYNMRPEHEGESKKITDIDDFCQVLDVIYQIRCNLFHGQKSEIDPRDTELVELAFLILSQIFEPIVENLDHE